MPRLTKFEEYRDRYPDFALEKTDDGILLMRMHRDGGPAVWDERTHHDTANLFNDVAGDRDVRVVIYTGTGDTFNANWGQESRPALLQGSGRVGRGDGMVRKAPSPQPAGDRRHHDRGGERPLQHPFRAGADVRHRARLRRRLLPGHGPLPAQPLSRRRHPEHLAAGHGPQSLSLCPADGPEDHGPDGLRLGRRERSAAEGRADGSRLGDRQVSPPVLADRPAPYPPDLRPGVQASRGQRSRLRADAWSSWA